MNLDLAMEKWLGDDRGMLKNASKHEQKSKDGQRNSDRSRDQSYGKRYADDHKNESADACHDASGQFHEKAEHRPDEDKRKK